MKKNYQMNDAATTGLAGPESVTVAMAELAADVQEGLLAMAVGTGLQVMTAMMNADVAVVCGPKGKHDLARTGVRHGTERLGHLGWPTGCGRAASDALRSLTCTSALDPLVGPTVV